MKDYSKSMIYKIVCDDPELVYYGSTITPLHKRFYAHKMKPTKGSKSVLEAENPKIILVEKYPCESQYELTARERYWIENNKCTNCNIPGIRPEERGERMRYFAKIHRDKTREWRMTQVQCACGAMITNGEMTKHLRTPRHFKRLNEKTQD